MATKKNKGVKSVRKVGQNKKWKRIDFEANVDKHKHTIAEIIDMYKRGVITDHDYLFTLESLIDINHRTYLGAWANCRQQVNPKSRWSREVGGIDAKGMIKDAFR